MKQATKSKNMNLKATDTKVLPAESKVEKATRKKDGGAQQRQQLPSTNWMALQKKIAATRPASEKTRKWATSLERMQLPKRRKASKDEDTSTGAVHEDVAFPRGRGPRTSDAHGSTSVGDGIVSFGLPETRNGESLEYLRRMIFGKVEYTAGQLQPGRYVGVDCEMVGVGPNGEESVLARASVVNYHGAVLLDAFVRPRERVVDYRTEFSGIREKDMVHAVPFEDAQRHLAELLKDRILVGHAVFNDMKALLLSHSHAATRDTQQLAGKHKLTNSRHPALRNLAQQELGITIQAGEHSSVTDARAAMALYRLHRKEWDKGWRPPRFEAPSTPASTATVLVRKKREREVDADSHTEESGGEEEDGGAVDQKTKTKAKAESKTKIFPGGGRKGVSSGLSTIIKRAGPGSSKVGSGRGVKEKWWTTLKGSPATSTAKGSIRVKIG